MFYSSDVVYMMSDEAYFHLDSYINKQNCWYWAAQNARELHQKPLHNVQIFFNFEHQGLESHGVVNKFETKHMVT